MKTKVLGLLLITAFICAGCTNTGGNTEVRDAQAPVQINSNREVSVQAVSRYFVLLSIQDTQTWEQVRDGEVVTSNVTEPVKTELQVSATYWSLQYCNVENIPPIEVKAMDSEGHYLVRFHTQINELPHLNLSLSNKTGQSLGSVCLNCDNSKSCP